jgi:hypothetical protein
VNANPNRPVTARSQHSAIHTMTSTNDFRSPKMYTMYEALARDRMRDEERRSREARLARELAAQRRWHRVSLRARDAEARHARRVSELPFN